MPLAACRELGVRVVLGLLGAAVRPLGLGWQGIAGAVPPAPKRAPSRGGPEAAVTPVEARLRR
ncbi:MAG: hypothetical protein M3Q27_04505, partial [Actinomycetota bacterium]|nr:hypothetical protein [Actinomycetota bacterium]